ncbi:ABC1 kinase family protein [Rubrivirga sp.]|uniref:ABC1 kinase family protein n=1 Tax=Rubrivirga sp. TaxID=1885344 RepID=UPI003B51655A
MTSPSEPLPVDPPAVVVPTAEAVASGPAIAVARPARRRFRLARAYTAALRVALSYLAFDLAARFRGERWARARRPALHARNGRRVRASILRLRGLFIKAGQLASVLTNLLPEPFRVELEGLQDRVPASPPEAARARVEAELGAPVEALFAAFEPMPVASASLAQVHRARLATGAGGDGLAEVREVAVKVQHTDIDAIARLDLRAIETILRVVGRWFGIRGLREQFREIEDVILGELDFVREAESGTEIARHLGPGVSVPAVVPERSARRVLTTDFVDGIKAGDLAALDAAGVDRLALAERILDAYGGMIFRDGLYHADPHPGNLLVRPDPAMPGGFELVFLDFGAVARLSPAMRTGLAEMIAGVLARNPARVTAALDVMGFTADAGSAQADAAVRALVEGVHERVLKNLDPLAFRLGDLTLEFAMEQHAETFDQMADLGVSVTDLASAFRVPRDWILLERTALLLIGLCSALAPDVNPLRVMERHIRPLTREAAPAIGAALWAEVQAAGRTLLGLPTHLDRVLTKAEAGQIAVTDPAAVAATERLARSVRGLASAVAAVGTGGIAYAAYAGSDGGIALALAVVAALFGVGTLRSGR